MMSYDVEFKSARSFRGNEKISDLIVGCVFTKLHEVMQCRAKINFLHSVNSERKVLKDRSCCFLCKIVCYKAVESVKYCEVFIQT